MSAEWENASKREGIKRQKEGRMKGWGVQKDRWMDGLGEGRAEAGVFRATVPYCISFQPSKVPGIKTHTTRYDEQAGSCPAGQVYRPRGGARSM